MKVKGLVYQSCLTLCDPMDYSSPGSSVPGILQARILDWVAFPFSRGIFLTQGSNLDLPHCRQILYLLTHYLKYKCIKRISRKTYSGWVDTKIRPVFMLYTTTPFLLSEKPVCR